jgi:hypothetical protein
MSAVVQRVAGLEPAYSSKKNLICDLRNYLLCVSPRTSHSALYMLTKESSKALVFDESCALERIMYDNLQSLFLAPTYKLTENGIDTYGTV